ncbi:hypothetical protein [Brachyspira sp.]|uniref:hypothetical protein n=1 Tax=Brachyspira sp. TaxID=1977261 RepID=UPI00262C8BB2|nr:hypothetical protein [Brachyspira sp.]
MYKIKILTILFIFYSSIIYAENTILEPSQSTTAKYRLFRTSNMWTFLKLETTTGKIWILQYDISGDSRFTIELNTIDLSGGKEKTAGRFTLYPTSNIYTFILLDQIYGNTWQVQWSFEEETRFIIPID